MHRETVREGILRSWGFFGFCGFGVVLWHTYCFSHLRGCLTTVISVSERSPSYEKWRKFNNATRLGEGSLVCSVYEIRVVERDHKFVAYSVLTKCLDLWKTENVAFLASRNYLSLIKFLKICPHSISDFQRTCSSKLSTFQGGESSCLKMRKL